MDDTVSGALGADFEVSKTQKFRWSALSCRMI